MSVERSTPPSPRSAQGSLLGRIRDRLGRLSSAAYVATDTLGRIHFSNDRACALLGASRERLHGRDFQECFPAARRAEWTSRIQRLAASPARGVQRWSARVQTLVGTMVSVEVEARCLEEDGQSRIVFSLLRAGEGGARAGTVDSADEKLRQFAYLASHDLRSPLTKISALTRILREDLGDAALGADARASFERLDAQVSRLDRLMTGLLDYARAGGAGEVPVEVDLASLFDQVIVLADVPPAFEVAWPGRLPQLACRPTPLKHTLLNLVKNAVEHHDHSPGRIRIECESEYSGWVRFAVQDDGPGIPAEQRHRVFDIFHTVGESDPAKGCGGVGLAIVKRLVESVDGAIAVAPTTWERGTRIEFSWPSA